MTDLLGTMSQQVAVYLDMDNIVISRYDELHGRDSFHDDRANSRNPTALVKSRLSEARLDLGAIIDYASSFGTVVISRAYANWAAPVNSSYATDTMRRSVDLVQLFPMVGSKNGADIRLAIDVVDDLSRFAGVTHVVVVAGDSDYVALAQRCKRLGRRVIGVGIAKSVSRYWESACDEFRFYNQLPGVLVGFAKPATGLGTAAQVVLPESAAQGLEEATLVRAMRLLASKNDSGVISASALKAQIKRLNPSFDEASLGYRNFTSYLRGFPGVVVVHTGTSGTDVSFVDGFHDTANPPASVGADDALAGGASHEVLVPPDLLALRRQLGLATSTSLGVDGEAMWIRAARLLWCTVDESEPRETLPQDEVVDTLVRSGIELAAAKRATHQILMTGMPMLVRNTEMTWRANQELTMLTDDGLLRLLRQWNADRARNRNYPESVPAERLAAALYPAPVPQAAIEAFEEIAGWGGYEQMREVLQPVLVPPLVLWDVAQAVCALPNPLLLPSVESFSTAVAAPLTDLEREPATVSMTAAYLSLREAGLITDHSGDAEPTGLPEPELEAVVDAVLRSWALRLRTAGLLATHEIVCREAFYRLALPDRYQEGQRAWLRDLLLSL